MPREQRFAVVEGDVPRVDRVVQDLTGLSRSAVRGLSQAGCVTLGGAPCAEAGTPVPAGTRVDVAWDPNRRYRDNGPTHVSRAFRVAFEDRHLVVVEKAAGILTVPTVRRETNTLVHEVMRYWSRGQRVPHRAHIVHRLDADTSGLLVFARTEAVAQALKRQFEDRKPRREYAAIVAGRLDAERGTFRSYLATDEDLDQYSTDEPGEGKLAVTHWEVVRHLKGATFVRVRLETGRRNQIRVHFAEAGHPVLGDLRYRPEAARHPAWRHPRLALHARTLGFVHPVTGVPVEVTSDLPAEFDAFVQKTALQGGGT
jgi:23S rRNA pseudouridine1911/1915/1917 synthase